MLVFILEFLGYFCVMKFLAQVYFFGVFMGLMISYLIWEFSEWLKNRPKK